MVIIVEVQGEERLILLEVAGEVFVVVQLVLVGVEPLNGAFHIGFLLYEPFDVLREMRTDTVFQMYDEK